MSDSDRSDGYVGNDISGGVFFNVVAQGRNVTLQLPRQITPALTGMPAPSSTFTGRKEVLNELTEALHPKPSGENPPKVHAVSGLAGVGKTELVLQVARHALSQTGWFPGGVLFIDLFGYDRERRLSPERALGSLLRALGIPDEHIATDLQDRARLYCSVLSAYADQGRRILVVVDNARTSEQAAPLLPGDPRIPVLLTSRHTLASLGARLCDLSVLDEDASVELLRTTLHEARGPGDTRVPDAPATAADLARLCGFLPLALRIVAALLADLPQRPLSSMVYALKDTRMRLERLARENLAVRAAFRLSYEHLSGDQARLFRLLPLNPGPDLSTETAAQLAGTDSYSAEELLQALARGHLIEPGSLYGRWRMHDLIHLYADELGQAQEEDDRRATTVLRLLRHYATTTVEASSHISPEADASPRFPDRAAALAWFDEEQANLIAAASSASDHGHPEMTVVLTSGLTGYLGLRRRFEESIALCKAAEQIAIKSRQPLVEAGFLSSMGGALRQLCRYNEAVGVHERCLRIVKELGHTPGEAEALTNLGVALQEMRRLAEAVPVLRRAITLQRKVANRSGEGMALNNLGRTLDELRRFDEAADVFQQDIDICREIGDLHGEATTLNNLGLVLLELDRAGEAITAHDRAACVFRETGDRYSEAMALNNLGTALREGGFGDGVEAHFGAIAILRELGDEHGEGTALMNLGLDYIGKGLLADAIATFAEAVQILQRVSDPHSHAGALMNLGTALHMAGLFDKAIDALRHAIAYFQATGDRHGEANACGRLGLALWDVDRPEEATASVAESAAAFQEIGDLERAARSGQLESAMREGRHGR